MNCTQAYDDGPDDVTTLLARAHRFSKSGNWELRIWNSSLTHGPGRLLMHSELPASWQCKARSGWLPGASDSGMCQPQEEFEGPAEHCPSLGCVRLRNTSPFSMDDIDIDRVGELLNGRSARVSARPRPRPRVASAPPDARRNNDKVGRAGGAPGLRPAFRLSAPWLAWRRSSL